MHFQQADTGGQNPGQNIALKSKFRKKGRPINLHLNVV